MHHRYVTMLRKAEQKSLPRYSWLYRAQWKRAVDKTFLQLFFISRKDNKNNHKNDKNEEVYYADVEPADDYMEASSFNYLKVKKKEKYTVDILVNSHITSTRVRSVHKKHYNLNQRFPMQFSAHFFHQFINSTVICYIEYISYIHIYHAIFPVINNT